MAAGSDTLNVVKTSPANAKPASSIRRCRAFGWSVRATSDVSLLLPQQNGRAAMPNRSRALADALSIPLFGPWRLAGLPRSAWELATSPLLQHPQHLPNNLPRPPTNIHGNRMLILPRLLQRHKLAAEQG